MKLIEDATKKNESEEMKRRSGMSGAADSKSKYKPQYASLTEEQAAMCFANTVFDRE